MMQSSLLRVTGEGFLSDIYICIFVYQYVSFPKADTSNTTTIICIYAKEQHNSNQLQTQCTLEITHVSARQ